MSKLFFCFLLATGVLFGQNVSSETLYLDSLKMETNQGRHSYYRIIEDYYKATPPSLFKIKDYYKSGVLEMEGNSSEPNRILQEGQFIHYYENGNTKLIENYAKGKLVGRFFEWYENGAQKNEAEYLENSNKNNEDLLKAYKYWDENGNQKIVNGTGVFALNRENITERGEVIDGLKNGIWEGEDNALQIKFKEEYKRGAFIKGVSTDLLSNEYHYTEIGKRASPKNGLGDFYKFISKNFSASDKLAMTGGKIIFSFYVEKDGSIKEVKVLESDSKELTDVIPKLVKKCNFWEPGIQRGQIIRQFFTLPLKVIKMK